MRFVLDEDVDAQAVGSLLRHHGHDCWSVVAAGLGGADDDAVAIYADDQDAVLITHYVGGHAEATELHLRAARVPEMFTRSRQPTCSDST